MGQCLLNILYHSKKSSLLLHDFLQKFGFQQFIGCIDRNLINVEINWPCTVHDARVFPNSEVQKRYSEKKPCFIKSLLPGEEWVPQVILADPAYPLLPYVIKEDDICRSNEEDIFNQMLCSGHNQIECAFGRLKAR